MESLEVRIISLAPKPLSLARLQSLFRDVAVSRAVDLRDQSAHQLFERKMITATAAETMLQGRKWHREFSRPGAVGLAQSMIRVLGRSRNANTWTLMCEEDCSPRPDLPAIVQKCIDGFHSGCAFDAALIGSVFRESAPSCIPGFHRLSGLVYMTHCMLIPPEGHAVLLKILQPPLEVQVDALFTQHIRLKRLNMIAQVGELSAVQDRSESTIQSACPLCNLSPQHKHPPVTCANDTTFLSVLLTVILLLFAYIAFKISFS